MKFLYLPGLTIALSMFLNACSDPPNSCTTNVARCSSTDLYSCPAADKCYKNKTNCAISGECP